MNLNDFVVIPNKPKSVKLNVRNLCELRMETVTLAQQSKDMEDRLLQLKESMSREKEERERSGRLIWRSGQVSSDSSTKNKENGFQKLPAGRVKITILKDEPCTADVHGVVERAPPPVSSGQLSSRNSCLTSKACGQCETRMAGLMCAECGEDYCVGCFARFHQRGALKLHRMIPIQTEIHTSVSMLDVAHRFQRQVHPKPDPSLNPNPNSKIPGPGPQNAVRGVERSWNNKTQAPPTTTQCQLTKDLFLNAWREEREEDYDDDEEEEERNRSFLLGGEYDEKESSHSFQKALREWRGGRREGGERREEVYLGSVVCGTRAALVGPDKGGPTEVPPIRVEFQQHSLSYLDRLLLKKHRRTPIEAHQLLSLPALPPVHTHSEEETTHSLTAEEVELRRYCASLFSVASSPPPVVVLSGACLSIQELDETIGGRVGKEVFAEEEEDEHTQFTSPPLVLKEDTTHPPQLKLNATQSTQPVPSSPQSPRPIHSTPQSTQPIHSTPRSPHPIHSTPRSIQPIYSTPRSPQPIHSTPRSAQAACPPTAWSKPEARPSAVQLSSLLGGSPRKPKTFAKTESPALEIPSAVRQTNLFLAPLGVLTSCLSAMPSIPPSSPCHLPLSYPTPAVSSFPPSPSLASSLWSVTLAPPSLPALDCSPPLSKSPHSTRIMHRPPSEIRSLPNCTPPPFAPSAAAGPNANAQLSPPPSPLDSLLSSTALSTPLRNLPLSPSTSLSSCCLSECPLSPQDTYCTVSFPPFPSLNLSSPNQLSFRGQSPPLSLLGSEGKQEKGPELPTRRVSPLMLMSDSEDDASCHTLVMTPCKEDSSDEEETHVEERSSAGTEGSGRTQGHSRSDPVEPMPGTRPCLASEPSKALHVLAQREGIASDHFCSLEEFLTLGLDLGSSKPSTSLLPTHTDQDIHHNAHGPSDPLNTGSESWRPSRSSKSYTEDHLVAMVMTDSTSQPMQSCMATPTRRHAVSAHGYCDWVGGATPRLRCSASAVSRPWSASRFRPLSRATREIQEISGVDKGDCGNPVLLDEDADSLSRLEDELRHMTPEPSQTTWIQEIKDGSRPGEGAAFEEWHKRRGPDRMVSEYQSDEEAEMRDQLRDQQSVLSLP